MARIGRKPDKADLDEYFDPVWIAGVGSAWSGPSYKKDPKVKEIRVVGFVRPKPAARRDAKPQRRR